MCDFTCALAVCDGEGTPSRNLDDLGAGLAGDAIAVEAENDAGGGLPVVRGATARDGYIIRQIVVTACCNLAEAGNTCPTILGCGVTAGAAARCAADAVVVRGGFFRQLQIAADGSQFIAVAVAGEDGGVHRAGHDGVAHSTGNADPCVGGQAAAVD